MKWKIGGVSALAVLTIAALFSRPVAAAVGHITDVFGQIRVDLPETRWRVHQLGAGGNSVTNWLVYKVVYHGSRVEVFTRLTPTADIVLSAPYHVEKVEAKHEP